MSERIVWDTPIETTIVWGFKHTERGYFMYQHTSPVRKDNPQYIQYTFRKRSDGTPIDLTNYFKVRLSVKTAGVEAIVLHNAEFDADKTTGVVLIEDCILSDAGQTSLQFIAYEFIPYGTEDAPLCGDPAMVEVVKNNADLTVDEIPQK